MLAVLCVWFFFLFFFFGNVLWTNPILGAAFWVKVCTISSGQMQEGVTLQTPPPYVLLHHLFISTQPFDHTSAGNPVEVALVTSLVTGDKGMRVQKGGTIFFALCRCMCHSPSFFLFPPPVLHRLRSRFSMTVYPHRNPPEQPGESPCIHRLSAAQHSNNYANRHRHIPTHTHTHVHTNTYSPLDLAFHPCIN